MKTCRQCGAPLTDGQAFCTKCGAPVAGMKFCMRCGAPLEQRPTGTIPPNAAADNPLRTASDADVAPQRAESHSSSGRALVTLPGSVSTQASGSAAVRQPQTSPSNVPRGRSATRLAGVAGGIVVILIVALIAGIWYVVHRARQKTAELEARYDLERTFSDASKHGKRSGKSGEQQSSTDYEKNLSQLAAAANAMAQGGGSQDSSAATSSNSSVPNSPNISNSGATAPGLGSAAPNGWTLVNGKLVPAPRPQAAPAPKPVPMVAVAATGDQTHDWALEYERTVNGPEAELVVRTGDINNLGFGWKYYDWSTKQTKFLDPFSGQSTQPHQWPDIHRIPPNAPAGTDRIMLGSAVIPGLGDGYSGAIGDCWEEQQLAKNGQAPPQITARCNEERALTAPTPIVLLVGALPSKINAVVVQIFVDDFQPVPMHSHFQVSLNGTRIPNFEYAINALDQSGPIGKLLTLKLLPEYWPLLKSGTVKLLIDDPTTHVPDGYAVDFVRILVNPHTFKYQVSLTAKVADADKHTPISGATVTAALESKATDSAGKCAFSGLPAGLVIATANAPGYDENSAQVDLPAGKTGEAEILLHRHQETTAALEQSIAQSGTVNVYGIHFDTGSSKLRPDSVAALQAILGLIKAHPSSSWIIAGHTDSEGSDSLNIPLSKARAESVVSWLSAHGAQKAHLVPQGFGATRPVADNNTAAGRALNRRVEVAVAR
jgi:OOP family OmpA-OmpF porin